MNLAGFSSGAIEGGSGEGIGLCQWSFGRREALENYASSKGKEWSDENIQIEFLIGELTKSGGADGYATYQLCTRNGYTPSDWINAGSVDTATEAFCYTFERPNEEAAKESMDERKKYANEYYNKYKGLTSGFVANNDSSEKWLKGTARINGRTFYIYNQNMDNSYEATLGLQDWVIRCGRAATISITSGYSVTDKTSALDLMKKADVSANLPSPEWFSNYGLTLEKVINKNTGECDYRDTLRTVLQSGGHAIIYVRGKDNEGVNYGGIGVSGITGKGTSGTVWTTEWHWMAILGYRNQNGVEQMFISNSTSAKSGWYGLDEFLVDGGKEVSSLFTVMPSK